MVLDSGPLPCWVGADEERNVRRGWSPGQHVISQLVNESIRSFRAGMMMYYKISRTNVYSVNDVEDLSLV